MNNIEGLTVAVAGLGPMGRGIARVFDRAGARVIVSDVSLELAQLGLEQIRQEAEADGNSISVTADTLEGSLLDADLFIEAIVENMEIKTAMLGKVMKHGRDDLIVASNTSSLSVGEMGKAFGDPARVIGMHFFNPPTKMRLVEVIKAAATSDEVHSSVLEIVAGLGKTAVSCADSPNFVVNRVCRPLYYEAQLLVMQGLEPAVVDAVARGALGHRMGPLELLDFTGLHTHLASSETALREFGDPRYRPIPQVRGLVRNGMTGKAAGRGFYRYQEESTREARTRVTELPGDASEGIGLEIIGPHADELRKHPSAACLLSENPDVTVFSCHRAPSPDDLGELRKVASAGPVVVDSSDAAWAYQLPAGVDWIRLHAWREHVFAEVVRDDVAGINPSGAVPTLLAALRASSVGVLALPGLVADRLANSLANEAYAVVEEGTANREDVDTALRLAMNHPLGPLEYVDRVGVTTVYAGMLSLLNAFGDPRYRPAQLMRRQDSLIARKSA